MRPHERENWTLSETPQLALYNRSSAVCLQVEKEQDTDYCPEKTGNDNRAPGISQRPRRRHDVLKKRQSNPSPPRYGTILRQESLADAKVSARQQCVYEGP